MGAMITPMECIIGERDTRDPWQRPLPWFYRYPFMAGLSGGAGVFFIWLITRLAA